MNNKDEEMTSEEVKAFLAMNSRNVKPKPDGKPADKPKSADVKKGATK